MSWVEVLLLAFALSIDACVVSFSYGIKGVQHPIKSALSLAVFTGGFQALMPFVGGVCTNCVRCYIEPYAKWIVFAIFLYLGINFIKESFENKNVSKDLSLTVLFLIAVATSIDAFSAGISLCLKLDCIVLPVLLIGLITFVNSIIGFSIGRVFKHLNTKFLEILGGIILIVLALKVII